MFGKDSSNNYGYIAPGADTVVPFKYYKILASSISESHTFDLTTLFPNNYSGLTSNNFLVVLKGGQAEERYNNINTVIANLNYTNTVSNNILTTNIELALNMYGYFNQQPQGWVWRYNYPYYAVYYISQIL